MKSKFFILIITISSAVLFFSCENSSVSDPDPDPKPRSYTLTIKITGDLTTDLITDVIADTIVDATSCASRFNQNYTYVWHTVSATGTIITSFKMDSDKTIYGVASAANPDPDPVKSDLKTYIFDAD